MSPRILKPRLDFLIAPSPSGFAAGVEREVEEIKKRGKAMGWEPGEILGI